MGALDPAGDRTVDPSACAARSPLSEQPLPRRTLLRRTLLRRTLLLSAATAGLWLAGSLGHAGSAEAATLAPTSPVALTQPVSLVQPAGLSQPAALPAGQLTGLPTRSVRTAQTPVESPIRIANVLGLPAHSVASSTGHRSRLTTARVEGSLDRGLPAVTLPLPAPAPTLPVTMLPVTMPSVALPALPVAGSLSPVTAVLGLLAGSLTATVQALPAGRPADVPGSVLRPPLGLVRTAGTGLSGDRAGSSRRLAVAPAPTPGPEPVAPAGIPPTGGTTLGGSTTMTLLAPGSCPVGGPGGLSGLVQQHSPAPRERASAPAVSPD
jgi:hypothetical protein